LHQIGPLSAVVTGEEIRHHLGGRIAGMVQARQFEARLGGLEQREMRVEIGAPHALDAIVGIDHQQYLVWSRHFRLTLFHSQSKTPHYQALLAILFPIILGGWGCVSFEGQGWQLRSQRLIEPRRWLLHVATTCCGFSAVWARG
jgi:hypothetical protein